MSNDHTKTGRELARLITALDASNAPLTVCSRVTIGNGPGVGIAIHTPDGTEIITTTGQHLGTFP